MSNVEGQPLISTKGSTYPISPQILISTEYYLDLLAKSPNTDFEILKHTFLELLGCFSNHLARHLVHSHHLSLRFSYFRNGAIAVSIIQQLLHNPIQSPLISILRHVVPDKSSPNRIARDLFHAFLIFLGTESCFSLS